MLWDASALPMRLLLLAPGKTKGLCRVLLTSLAITPCFLINQFLSVHQPPFREDLPGSMLVTKVPVHEQSYVR